MPIFALRLPRWTLLLAALPVAACNCETDTFAPSAKYVPDKVLDFGKVAVSSEKKMFLKVVSEGSAALRISSANLNNISPTDMDVVRDSIAPNLTSGLTPGRTSSITVIYRPCPGAWMGGTGGMPGNLLTPGFDFSKCPGDMSGEIDVVDNGHVNGKAGHTQIVQLSGQSVQPPNVLVDCQIPMPKCQDTRKVSNPVYTTMGSCVALDYGTVNAGDPMGPCTRFVQVTNAQRSGRDVGDLEIQKIEILVKNLNSSTIAATSDQVGFKVVDMNGMPLSPTSANPIVVSVPEGSSMGSFVFGIQYNGQLDGTWYGQKSDMQGVRIYTNDPDKPVVGFNIDGTGAAPDLQVTPQTLLFGNVQQGRTKTLTATVSNFGSAPLQITSIGNKYDTQMSKFVISTSMGTHYPITLNERQSVFVHVAYTPNTGGMDADTLQIGNNDPKTNGVKEVPMSGGAVPCISVTPAGTITFPTPNPPTNQPRTLPMTIANCGYGNLIIQRMQILGQNDDPMDPTIQEFSIMECPAGMEHACDLNITLCPPSDMACAMPQKTFNVTYQNMDISVVDYAQLHIISNDPANPNYLETLEAHDVPCFPPEPVISPPQGRSCVNMPVMVTSMGSNPGGPGGTGATITGYSWSFTFAPGTQPMITPANGSAVMFTPDTPGTYLLSLTETNDCGAMGRVTMDQMISVADTCN
jgi:hypothetical protein